MPAAAALAATCVLWPGCAGPRAAPPEAPEVAASMGDAAGRHAVFVDRAADALRARGHRVERRSADLVRARPRPVPSGLEPWRSGPGRGGLPLAAAATLGEVREIAALRLVLDGAVAAEVWLERARRPRRRLVVRAGGDVFSDAGVFSERRADPVAPAEEVLDPVEDRATPGLGSGEGVAEDPLFPADNPLFPAAGASPADAPAVRWDRWRRLPEAEADLLAAYRATGG